MVELNFDAKDQNINMLDKETMEELWQAIQKIASDSSIAALLFTSSKEDFLVGADVNAFLGYFSSPIEEFEEYMWFVHNILNTIEDLNIPTAIAINGVCLGGGMELALSTDYRILTDRSKVGFPEVKLGIFPGWGGSVRLPRLIGPDNAIEWIASGSQNRADAAFKVGVADSVVAPDKLIDAALNTLKQSVSGIFDWKSRKVEKKSPLSLTDIEAGLAFETAKAFVASKAGPHYPAPVTAIKSIQQSAKLSRDDALKVEYKNFVKVAMSDVTKNLVSIFLADQYLKKEAKRSQKIDQPFNVSFVQNCSTNSMAFPVKSTDSRIPKDTDE